MALSFTTLSNFGSYRKFSEYYWPIALELCNASSAEISQFVTLSRNRSAKAKEVNSKSIERRQFSVKWCLTWKITLSDPLKCNLIPALTNHQLKYVVIFRNVVLCVKCIFTDKTNTYKQRTIYFNELIVLS